MIDPDIYTMLDSIKGALYQMPIDQANTIAHDLHKIVSERLYLEAIKKIGPR